MYTPPYPPSTPPRPPFRVGRGLLHAFLTLVAILGIFGTLAVVLPVADPERFGEGVGRFAFFTCLGALGVSALAQTGRRIAAWVVGGLLVMSVASVVVVLVVVAPELGEATARPLPPDELVRVDGALRHPRLGFSLPDLGPSLQPEPGAAQQIAGSVPGSRGWVYADKDAREVVIVLLTADTSTSERAFSDFFEGTVRGQVEAMSAAGMTAEERERSFRWDDRRAHRHIALGDALHQRIDAFGLPGGESFMLFSTAPTAERFAALADGVRVP